MKPDRHTNRVEWLIENKPKFPPLFVAGQRVRVTPTGAVGIVEKCQRGMEYKTVLIKSGGKYARDEYGIYMIETDRARGLFVFAHETEMEAA